MAGRYGGLLAPLPYGGAMVRSRAYLLAITSILGILSGLVWACGGSDQDRGQRRRDLARRMCESAVLDHLTSRATAHFAPDDEHVYYDSVGGAAVSGIVATVSGQRNFACVLTPESDTTWTLAAARLLD
jgi:hypothetical protein